MRTVILSEARSAKSKDIKTVILSEARSAKSKDLRLSFPLRP
jgi:hypothetical protein